MQDIQYKKSLLKSLNLPQEDVSILASVVGRQEFLQYLQSVQNIPEVYEGAANDFFNVKNAVFQANFHIHTDNSDGFMSVEELMNLGCQYADVYATKNPGKKVYLAITDHDNIYGNIQALKLLIQNPKRYRNLKIVLGMEMTSFFYSKYVQKPINTHLLTYCINPFTSPVVFFNSERLDKYNAGVISAYSKVMPVFQDAAKAKNFQYVVQDLQAVRPQIYQFPHDIENTFKDTLQFKYLFYSLVFSNPKVVSFLGNRNIDISKLDFTQPKKMIQAGEKRPYWLNYVDETYNYLHQILAQKNISSKGLKEALNVLTQDEIEVLNKMETAVRGTFSPFFYNECQPIDFDKVVCTFAKDTQTLSAIAHPAFTLQYHKENPERLKIINEFISRFKKHLGNEPLIIEKFYPYSSSLPTKWIDEVYSVAGKFNYIPSGSRDSHRNSFFTRDKIFTPQELNMLIHPKKIAHQHRSDLDVQMYLREKE